MIALNYLRFCILGLMVVANAVTALAQITPPPVRSEGDGAFERLVLRGGTLIDGTGAPAIGPVDIVIEKNRITEIQVVGYPGVDIPPERRPDPGVREMDVSGMYV